MTYDVFISHSARDKRYADAICAKLESRGIRCWIAPRDIHPGMEWGAAIIEAIEGARVMLLVFSSHSNGSPQISREVERAVHKELTVMPVRVEDVMPTGNLEYFLGTPHWLDAITPPFEQHLEGIAAAASFWLERLASDLGTEPRPPRADLPQGVSIESSAAVAGPTSSPANWVKTAVVALVIATLGAAAFFVESSSQWQAFLSGWELLTSAFTILLITIIYGAANDYYKNALNDFLTARPQLVAYPVFFVLVGVPLVEIEHYFSLGLLSAALIYLAAGSVVSNWLFRPIGLLAQLVALIAILAVGLFCDTHFFPRPSHYAILSYADLPAASAVKTTQTLAAEFESVFRGTLESADTIHVGIVDATDKLDPYQLWHEKDVRKGLHLDPDLIVSIAAAEPAPGLADFKTSIWVPKVNSWIENSIPDERGKLDEVRLLAAHAALNVLRRVTELRQSDFNESDRVQIRDCILENIAKVSLKCENSLAVSQRVDELLKSNPTDDEVETAFQLCKFSSSQPDNLATGVSAKLAYPLSLAQRPEK